MGMPLFYNSYDGDREYDADSMTEWLLPFFTTGIFNGGMQVKANGNMSVNVGAGYCNIGGKTKHFEEETTLDIEIASGTLNRIDNVVLRRDDANRDIYLMIQKGGNAKTPSVPKIVRDGAIYDLKLAEIFIAAGTIKITQANITDCRMLSDVCGWVVATVDEIDFTQIQAQFDCYLEQFEEDQVDEFTRWFDGIKKQFTDDAVGGLQTQINETKQKMDNLTPGDIGAVPENDLTTSYMYSGNMASAGWYRIAVYHEDGSVPVSQGSLSPSCGISLKRLYNNNRGEYHKVELRALYQRSSFREISGYSDVHLLTKVRHVWDNNDKSMYIEVYYAGTKQNQISVTIEDNKTSYIRHWTAITPILTSESVDGVTVYSTVNLTANTLGSVSNAERAMVADKSPFLLTSSSSVNITPADGHIAYSYAINGSDTGVLPYGSNANAVMTVSRHPGKYYAQFGFSSNNNLYYRSTSNHDLDNSIRWNKIAFDGEVLFSGKSSTTSFPSATLAKSIAGFKRVKVYYSPVIGWYSASTPTDMLIGEAQVYLSALGSYVAKIHMPYTCGYEQYFCMTEMNIEGNKLNVWCDNYLNNGAVYEDNGGGTLPYKGVVTKVIGYYD